MKTSVSRRPRSNNIASAPESAIDASWSAQGFWQLAQKKVERWPCRMLLMGCRRPCRAARRGHTPWHRAENSRLRPGHWKNPAGCCHPCATAAPAPREWRACSRARAGLARCGRPSSWGGCRPETAPRTHRYCPPPPPPRRPAAPA